MDRIELVSHFTVVTGGRSTDIIGAICATLGM